MSSHPTGEIVEIVGINSSTNGCSCEEHHTCGCVLEEDTLVRLRKHQVYINGHEQSAVGVYWVSDGVDRCLVGFLHCHQVKHLNKLEGALCQVTEVYSDNSDSPTKRHKHKKNFGCAIVAIGLLPELCITFHLHYISFALHLKNLPCQHEMHAMSRFTTFIS